MKRQDRNEYDKTTTPLKINTTGRIQHTNIGQRHVSGKQIDDNV